MTAILVNAMLVLGICTQAVFFVAIGWFLKRRQLEKTGLTAAAVEQLLSNVGELSASVAADLGDHASQIANIGEQLASRSNPEAASEQGPDLDAITEILQANRKLQEKLAVTEQRLREYAEKADLHLAEARHDALTRLANRRAMDEALEVQRAAWQQGKPAALIMLDVDRFKSLNDQFGHPAGDRVLVEIGKALAETCPQHGLAARMGGEEFGVLLPGASLDEAKALAETIRAAVARRKQLLGGKETPVTVSVGVAEAHSSDGPAELVAHADTALYAAKHNGRNRSYYFHAGATHPVLAQPVAEPEAQINHEMVEAIGQRLALAEPEREIQDRRNRKRSPFTGRQLIAPYLGNELPHPSKFFWVVCRDISSGGLGFYLPTPPEVQWIVVAIGTAANRQFVRARIAHHRPIEPGRDDCFIVGCQFTERLAPWFTAEASHQFPIDTPGGAAA